ncbi:MAG: hypothetical protein IT452_18185 [Planctomycetia bacterium]|nr:hypothetical protein [Planctomycetia bacterium]
MKRLSLLLGLLATTVQAEDVLVLNNQHEIAGTIVNDDGDVIVVQTTAGAGRVSCPYPEVATINGLPAPRVRELRLEARHAQDAFARRGLAAPPGLQVRGWSLEKFGETARASTAAAPPLAALVAFGLAEADSARPEAAAAWRAAHRHAAARPAESLLILLVPDEAAPDPTLPFWRAAGLRTPSYAVTREFGIAALDAATAPARDAAVALAGTWSDAELALYAARTGTAAAVALDALLDPPGLGSDQGDIPLELAALGDAPSPPDAPRFLAAWRAFAENEGLRFARTARLAGGWRLAFHVMDDPPSSSEQILHPEKYFVDRDTPSRVELAPLGIPRDAASFGFVAGGSLGEAMLLQSLLNAAGRGRQGLDAGPARAAATGWDGDAWQVYASRDGSLALAWITAWDSPEDAREFAEAAAAAGALRRGRGKTSPDGTRLRFESAGARGVAEWKDRQCVVVEGMPTEEAAVALAEAVWAGRRVRKEPVAPIVLAPRDAVTRALATTDALAPGWSADPPAAQPLGGRFDTGTRTWRAAGAFSASVPADWEATSRPSALVLAPPAPGLTVTVTFHRLAADAPPALVFARARSLAARGAAAPFLPYDARTADGRAWCQFAVTLPDHRAHFAWAVSGRDAVRVEAVAPPSGAPPEIRKALQDLLATVRFERE